MAAPPVTPASIAYGDPIAAVIPGVTSILFFVLIIGDTMVPPELSRPSILMCMLA